MAKKSVSVCRYLAGLAFVALICLPLVSIAAPYGPDGKAALYRQPDGSTVKVRVFGDEFYAVAETEEGYTVVYDENKVLRFGTLSADGKKIVPTGLPANNKPDHAKLQGVGLKKGLRVNKQGRKLAVAKGLQRMRADRKGRITPQSVEYYEQKLSTAGIQPSLASSEAIVFEPPVIVTPDVERTGQYVGLCILVDFSDQAGTIPPSDVDDYCNKPNYTGYSNAGSIYDFFFKQSNGRLQYNNIVTAYVRVPSPKTFYDDGVDGSWGNSRAQDLVSDALDVLVADGFDFTQLSRDGSGNIYSLNLFYAGTCASGWSTGLWPHKWAIPTKTVDAANGIKAYSYQMSDMGNELDIGTFCHENGHMLMGYPDLYSYDGNAANFGNYSLMAGGSHTGGGKHPTNVDPYLKTTSGWAEIIDLDSSSHQRCTLEVDGNLFYRYKNPSNTREYFLFEVRDNTGYEGVWGGASTAVNPGTGLVAYHVLETGDNPYGSIFTARNPTNDYSTPYECLMIEANQKTTITPWYDDPTPDTSDAFKASGKDELSDSTAPALKFWDATGRNTMSDCVIHSISADGPVMTFIAGAGALVSDPAVALGSSIIDNTVDAGQTAPSKTFTVGNGGGGTLTYTISDNQSWLSCTPAAGTATSESDTITVDFSTLALSAGSYSATITVEDSSVPTSDTITVNLTVNPQPVLQVSPLSISENAVAGEAAKQVELQLVNSGGGTLNYSLSKTQSWLTLTPTSGTILGETDTIYVTLDCSILAAGSYNDTITVTSAEASNSPITIPVSLSVNGSDIIVSYPNGGEELIAGATTNMTWSSSIGGTVSVELLKGGNVDTMISASTANDGSLSWAIPTNKGGTNYQIRVTSLDASPGFDDTSDGNFSIVASPLIDEDFENGGSLPTGWTQATISGAATWAVQTGGYTGGQNPATAHSGTYNVTLYRANTGDNKTRLYTPVFDSEGYGNLSVRFWHAQPVWSPDQDFLEVYYSTNSGSSWVFLEGYSNSISAWTEQELSLPAGSSQSQLAFEGNAKYGYGVSIDDVTVVGQYAGPSYQVIIAESDSSTETTEGGASDTYTIALSSAPASPVTVNINPDSELNTSVSSLAFNSGDWNSPKTVTVFAVDDGDHELIHVGNITHTTSSSDPNYNALPVSSVFVDITDDDNNAPNVYAGQDQWVLLDAGNPGLYFGSVPGAIDEVTPNPETSIITNISSETASIPANTTKIFTGKIFDADGLISFTEHIDDDTRIWIDGNLVLSGTSWSVRESTTNLHLSPGWHDIEIRIGNGTGGSGAQSSPGVGFDSNGGTNWQELDDPGDGSLLTAGLSPVNANLSGVVSDPDGDPLTTLWTLDGGPAAVTLDDDSITNAVATFSQEGVYTLQLSASDTITQVVDTVVITVTTNAIPPAILAPSDLNATAVATNQINLTWSDNSDNETGFVIERSATDMLNFAEIHTTTANVTNYLDTGLSVGVAYFYRVYATNSTDTSAVSSVAFATTPKIQATVTLSNLSQAYDGTARSVGTTTDPVGLTVDVTYDGDAWAPTNAGSYAVVATINESSYEGSTNGTLEITQVAATVNTWPTAAPITVGDALSSATLSGGSGSVAGAFSYDAPATTPPVGIYTADVTFVPSNPNYQSVGGTISVDVTPAAPTGLGHTPLAGQVNLSWNAAAGASSYNVKRATLSGGPYTTIGSPAGAAYSDTTVTNGEAYYYIVSAVGAGGEGPDSAEHAVVLPQSLPFTESFDGPDMASSLGMVNGQRGWTGGSNSLVQAGVGRGGTNGLSIAEDGATLTVMNGSNVVSVSFWIKPVAGAEPKPADLATNASAVIWVGTNQQVMVYSNSTIVTLPATVVPDQWVHFDAIIDYVAGSWDLAVDGTNAATGLGIYAANANFVGIEISNTSPTATVVDDLNIFTEFATLSNYEIWLNDYFGTTSLDDTAISSNGVNTIRETYIIGLNPMDPAGSLMVSGIGSQSGNTVLNWGGVSGRLYNVYWSSNLMGGAGFQLLYSNIPWNVGSITDSVHNAENTGFYRIDVQLDE